MGQKGLRVLLVRHGESISNQSGTLSGWTDSPLTIRGRQQAHSLLPSLFPLRKQFQSILSSDLSRATDTAKISLGFPSDSPLTIEKGLRELNFGQDENKHFDSLSSADKDLVNTMEYSAPGGESWAQARDRA